MAAWQPAVGATSSLFETMQQVAKPSHRGRRKQSEYRGHRSIEHGAASDRAGRTQPPSDSAHVSGDVVLAIADRVGLVTDYVTPSQLT
ncbi:hypothetical protein [Cupriavidus necator]